MEQRNTIYRVAVGGLHCRSSVELVVLKVTALHGVEAASIGPDHALTVFAVARLVTPSDIVRTLVDAGVSPDSEVTAAPVTTVAAEAEPLAVAAADTAAVAAEDVMADIDEAPVPQPVGVRAAVAATQIPDVAVARPAPEVPAPTGSQNGLEPASPIRVAADVAQAAVEESIKADIETPHVAVSPRASLVQRIEVEVSDNYYPSRIEVIPGVPVDIVFGEGHGCLARVLFEAFGVDEDLTQGGAIVRLPGLAPGEYQFSCGMHMVHGTVVAAI